MAALMPMVWTACERENFVPEVQAMRRRVEALVPADVRDREIKLGTGGLRDVEFAVNCCSWCTAAPTSRCTSPRRWKPLPPLAPAAMSGATTPRT